MKTAEEFLDEKISGGFYLQQWELLSDRFTEIMIEFAKYHVQEALKEALECVPYGSSTDTVSYEDVEGILDCYPLENIK